MLFCSRCGKVNDADASQCVECGAEFIAERPPPPGGVSIALAILLLVIFRPVGLCGLAYTTMAVVDLPDSPDTFYNFAFGGFALVCFLVGSFAVYHALKMLTKK